MLVDQNGIAVGVGDEETRRARGAVIGFAVEGGSLRFQNLLNLSDIGKVGEGISGRVPSGIKGQGVFVKHALKQAQGGGSVAQDQPSLAGLAAHHIKTQFMIKGLRHRNVLNGQAERKSP